MNRREALKVVAATVLAMFVRPAPRRQIDLMSFCRKEALGKYELRLPWQVDDWTYASDARMCVRVRPVSADAVDHSGVMPPFSGLPWGQQAHRGWRELPKLEPMLADDSCCFSCGGTGYEGGVIGEECETCEGFGRDFCQNVKWGMAKPATCQDCKGSGVVPPPGVRTCPACLGNAVGRFPSIVQLDGEYFNYGLYEKLRRLGCEYVLGQHQLAHAAADPWQIIEVKFPEGEGLLLGIEKRAAERRLVFRKEQQ